MHTESLPGFQLLENLNLFFSKGWKKHRTIPKTWKNAESLPLLWVFSEAHSLHNKMNTLGNLFDDLPQAIPQELFTTLISAKNVRIERIVSFEQHSPDGFWYDQSEDEWILLLEGAAALTIQDRPSIILKPGDYLHLPSGCRHRVEKTAESVRTVWLAVFYKTR